MISLSLVLMPIPSSIEIPLFSLFFAKNEYSSSLRVNFEIIVSIVRYWICQLYSLGSRSDQACKMPPKEKAKNAKKAKKEKNVQKELISLAKVYVYRTGEYDLSLGQGDLQKSGLTPAYPPKTANRDKAAYDKLEQYQRWLFRGWFPASSFTLVTNIPWIFFEISSSSQLRCETIPKGKGHRHIPVTITVKHACVHLSLASSASFLISSEDAN
jgi:hypothetical protein